MHTDRQMHMIGRYLDELKEGGFGLLGPGVPGAHPQQHRKQGVREGHRQVILILLQVLHCNTSTQLLQQHNKGLVKPTVVSSSNAAWQHKPHFLQQSIKAFVKPTV